MANTIDRPTIEELRLKFGDPARSNDPRPFAFYSHKDGGLYMVLNNNVKDTTNGKTLVIYKHVWPFIGRGLKDAGQIYARPISEWGSRFTFQKRDTLYHLTRLGGLQHYQEQITTRKETRKAAEAVEFRRLQSLAENAHGE